MNDRPNHDADEPAQDGAQRVYDAWRRARAETPLPPGLPARVAAALAAEPRPRLRLSSRGRAAALLLATAAAAFRVAAACLVFTP